MSGGAHQEETPVEVIIDSHNTRVLAGAGHATGNIVVVVEAVVVEEHVLREPCQ